MYARARPSLARIRHGPGTGTVKGLGTFGDRVAPQRADLCQHQRAWQHCNYDQRGIQPHGHHACRGWIADGACDACSLERPFVKCCMNASSTCSGARPSTTLPILHKNTRRLRCLQMPARRSHVMPFAMRRPLASFKSLKATQVWSEDKEEVRHSHVWAISDVIWCARGINPNTASPWCQAVARRERPALLPQLFLNTIVCDQSLSAFDRWRTGGLQICGCAACQLLAVDEELAHAALT